MNEADSELYADRGKADRHRSTQGSRTFIKMKTQKLYIKRRLGQGIEIIKYGNRK